MIVIDSSIAVKWVLPEEYSDRALALVERAANANRVMVAPPLLVFEVANVLRRQMVRHGLSLADAAQAMGRFAAFPIELLLPRELSRRALEIADRFDLPAAYDAHLIALAEAFSCDLWTADVRLLRLVGSSLPFVRWIGGELSVSSAP